MTAWRSEIRRAMGYEEPAMCATCAHIRLAIAADGTVDESMPHPVMCDRGGMAVQFVGLCRQWEHKSIESIEEIGVNTTSVASTPTHNDDEAAL